MNREQQYIISGISALIIVGLLLTFLLLPLDVPIQPVGELITDQDNGDEDKTPAPEDLMAPGGDQLRVFDNVTITLVHKIGSASGPSSGNQGSGGNGGGGGGGGGGSRDRTPPDVTGIFSRPADIDDDVYTHPFTVTWVGVDDRSGIDFCDPPTNYSGPDGSSIVLVGHCTDNAGNMGTGNVTFNYNSSLFVPIFSYSIALSNNTIILGSNILATAGTNDTTIIEVGFVWTDPANNTKASHVQALSSSGTAQDALIPDVVGEWKVDAHFRNGTHADIAMRSKLFTVNSGGGNGGGGGNGNGNHQPVAINDTTTTLEDAAIVISVLANDSDPDGNSIFVSSFNQPGNGSITGNPNGTLTYTPIQNFNGQDSFSYRISDGSLQSANNATVIISVTSVNDPPIANAGADQTVNETSQVSLSGAASSDVDGDALTYSWKQINGRSVELNNTNSVTPSFAAPKVSKDSVLTFELNVTDGFGGSSTDTVNVKVLNTNGKDDGDDDCDGDDDKRKHKHGETHKHKAKDEDKHKHGDVHKHKEKGGDGDECNGGGQDDDKEKDNGNDKGVSDKDNNKEHEKSDDRQNDGSKHEDKEGNEEDDDTGGSNNEDKGKSHDANDDDKDHKKNSDDKDKTK